MKIRHFLTAALVVSGFAAGLASNHRTADSAGFAGKCYIAPFGESYSRAAAVFTGEVVSEDKTGDTRRFVLRVDKYWKGKISKEIEIFVNENARYQAWFKKGGTYLIFASADDAGKLRVGRCSRSKDVEFASEDLKKLGKGKTPR